MYDEISGSMVDSGARVKRMTGMFSRHFACRKCEGNIGEAVEQEKSLCDEEGTIQ